MMQRLEVRDQRSVQVTCRLLTSDF